MKVGIQSLKKGVNNFEFDAEVDQLEFDNTNFELVKVRVRSKVDKNEYSIVVTSEVESKVTSICESCLEYFSFELKDNNYVLLYASDKEAMAPDDEVKFIASGTQTLDLLEGVRESILVSLPMRFKCSDGCQGLCDQCGANLNTAKCSCQKKSVDPRWSGLAALLQRSQPPD